MTIMDVTFCVFPSFSFLVLEKESTVNLQYLKLQLRKQAFVEKA